MVLDEEYGQAEVLACFADERGQLVRFLRVHAGGRLIEQEQLRLCGERAGDLEAALLAVGQGSRHFVLEFCEADDLEQLERAGALTSLSEAESVLGTLQELEPVDEFRVREVDLGTGTVSCELHLPQALFYEELSRQAGVEIADDEALLQMLQELAQTKKLYDKVQTALEQVKATGYGIVMPGAEELKLEKPEIVKKNGNYAVKLRASAPSIHMLRAQIETEISPMVGGEQESQQLIDYLLGEYEEDTDKLWQSNIFGKSLYELVSEGVTAKIMRMPDDARQKLTKTLGRMINENTGGMICILL